MALKPQHRLFAAEYIKDLNATKAAIRAGYSEKSAYNQGSRLMKNDEIKNLISRHEAQVLKNACIKREDILSGLAEVILARPEHFRKADGTFALDDTTPNSRAVQKCVTKIHYDDDGNPAYTRSEIVMRDPVAAGERASRMLDFDAPEKQEHDHKFQVEIVRTTP